MEKLYKNDVWLYEKYWKEELSLRKIGRLCDTIGKPIRVWMMEKFGIPRRSKSEAQLGKKNPYCVGKVDCVCLKCEKVFQKYPSEVERGEGKYCSSTCWYEVNHGENHCHYNEVSRLPYNKIWGEPLKRKIRERDDYLCFICDKYGNVVHHIDHDKENCREDNLITMCRKCHGKHYNWRRVGALFNDSCFHTNIIGFTFNKHLW